MMFCATILPPRSVTASVVCEGWISKASTPRLPFRFKKVDLRPRGSRPHRSLNDPLFGKQLLDDERDGASLQSRGPRQIRTRNGLLDANLVEDEISIDLPGHLIR